ncbi:MAG: hypothetical protein COA38_18775 [Fluviicola sp.]|nr:MAG: hypothetical protein COA38_18775 [Fluviicola sp.]
MTDQELIEFGNKLIDKERTSIEIFNALSYKATDKEQLNRVHPKVVKPEAKKKMRSPELVNTLLKANNIKLKSEYSIRSLIRLAMVVLAIGGIVLFLSKEEVNQNAIFGWFTLAQGLTLLVLYSFVKFKGKTDLLLVSMICYFGFWLLEILVDGIPNDLLEVYNHVQLRTHNLRQVKSVAGARLIGYVFPFIYVGVKILIGLFTITSFVNHRKYDALPNDVKLELEDF